jgi:16S rRNA (adenine(1408)-N(1))-methyltransferase
VTIDVGSGDGRAVLAAARREPTTLALGLDASASAMVEASRRAARPARKGGLENVRFIVAAAEALPCELAGRAALVTVQFPWGSLLRGCVSGDEAVAAGLAGLVAPDGTLELLLAPAARDGLDDVPVDGSAIASCAERTFHRHGLGLSVARAATAAEVAGSASTWARRLGSKRPDDRRVMLVRLVRPPGGDPGVGGSGHGSDREE